MTDLPTAPGAGPSTLPSRPPWRRPPTRGPRPCSSSRGSPACRPCPSTPSDMPGRAEWVADRFAGSGRRTWRSSGPPSTRSSTGGSTRRRAGRRHWSTATTTSSPSTRVELWETAPWEPFLRDGRFVGRGVADDKGQLVMHLSALEALRTAGSIAGGQPHLRLRGRGGVRIREPVRLDRGEPRPPRGRHGDHQRHRLLRGQRPGDHGRAARHHVRPDRCRAVAGGPALGDVRRDGREPGQRPRPDHRRAQGPRRPDQDPGLLRRRRSP